MSSDTYVITTLLRAERDEAYEAIRAIDAAHMGILQGTLDQADLEEAINAAVKLLPGAEIKPVEKKVRRRRSTGYEDLF